MDGSGTADQVDRAAVSPGGSTAGATHARAVDPLTVTQRLQREGRWFGQIELERDEMMKLSKALFGKDKASRQLWVYAELDRMYPPLQPDNVGSAEPDNPTMSGEPSLPTQPDLPSKPDNVGSDRQIQGLSDLPASWPELPSNASLGLEVGWVQANRLRIVEERPGRATLIRLDRALSPAPSWAALGWVETSIRSYAKFVDVAAKAAGSGDDGEAAWMKREKMAIEEVEAIINEMMEDQADREHDNVGSAES